MSLEVIIVGAGISGLCTAVALHKAGHSVKVFEKSRFTGEVGSAVLITPAAERVLSRLGVDWLKARGDAVAYFEVFDGITLASLNSHDLLDPTEEFGAPLYTVHRVDLLNELLRLASGLDIRLGTKVSCADANTGVVVLEDGTRHFADLVVAGDGMHSVLRAEVLRHHPDVAAVAEATRSGMSTFRFMIPTKAMQNDPQFQELLRMRGKGCALFADSTRDSEHHMVWFTCRERSIQVFVGVHDSIVANPEQLKDLMLSEFGHYHPSLIRMFSLASLVTNWRLDIHDPLPTWHHGKLVLIGDSAHPMLPLGAQGANQAIEDAGALGALLSNLTSVFQLSGRLYAYERVRRLRASRVQTLSKVRLGREKDVEVELRKYADPPGSDVPTTFSERYKHDYGFDVFDACRQAVDQEKVVVVP
ncbi:putative salicylate hydroxylase [Delitschia confertaspora ATCC 74209]|uniref:Salicylate hydroxylase n=1 Tax=Delitschia confertaspora ATCC 74209 TaxID=1513339 RepID=A0A9P4MSY0_9PLEO|nr:putative salicylate hydroxylase [Delitschia confertaspora ATCC 74209]